MEHPTLQLLMLLLLKCTSLCFAAKRCPPCGTTIVPYPLSTNPLCGDQSYKVHCDTEKSQLMFPTVNNTYPIISISASSQRLVVQPSPALPNACLSSDYIHQGFLLNASLPFRISGSNTIMAFNCTDIEFLSTLVNCSNNSPCHSSVYERYGGLCFNTPCCTYPGGMRHTSRMIWLTNRTCTAYTSFVKLELNSTHWPEPGLEIQWQLPLEPVCASQADCDSDHATCRPDNQSRAVQRCFCNAGLTWDPIEGSCIRNLTCQDLGSCSRSLNTRMIAGLVSGIGALVLLITIFAFLWKRQCHEESQQHIKIMHEEILSCSGSKAAKLFTGDEIQKATNNFSMDRLLGVGGYGEVYKGILKDGTVIAVKCAKVGSTKGTHLVLNEVRILSQVNHRNLVQLLGCCVDLKQPILVYEYIKNGSLFDYLHKIKGRRYLSWTSRLCIARDTAQGLSYLHTCAVPPVYHRDVKSSNILIDENLNAKVSDFGLSRLAEVGASHVSTCIQGTFGYLDPEYYKKYQLTEKSDVYSFGVVLLELLTGEKAVDLNRSEDDISLAIYVKRMVEEDKLFDVVDPVLKQEASSVELETMKAIGFLALSCLEEKKRDRPSMKEIVEEIECIISIATATNFTG